MVQIGPATILLMSRYCVNSDTQKEGDAKPNQGTPCSIGCSDVQMSAQKKMRQGKDPTSSR